MSSSVAEQQTSVARRVTRVGRDDLRIAIVVDHPRRDLAGLCLTAEALSQRGAVCHLVPFNLQRKEIWALRPHLVLLNYVRRGANEDLGRLLREAGVRVGVLDTEGGVWPSLDEFTRLLWSDPELLAGIRPYCAWGENLGKHVVAAGLMPASSVVVTGCPRFDLYHPKWRGLTLGAGRGAPVATKPRVLINTNFSDANPRFKTLAEQERVMLGLGYQQSEVRTMLDTQASAIHLTIEMADRLATDFPNAQIILRPHPFEDPARYAAPLASRGNVEVNAEGPVQAQILQSVAVIQRSCTTAIESAISGVPTFSPQWIPAFMLNECCEAVSEPCDAYASLKARLESAMQGCHARSPEVTNRVDGVVRGWFHRIDGGAAERVAEQVMKACQDRPTVNERLCGRLLYSNGAAKLSFTGRLTNELRRGLGLSPDWSFRRGRAIASSPRPDKRFDVAEVNEILGRIRSSRIEQGRPGRRIMAESAASRGDYLSSFAGHSITIHG